MQAAKQLKKVFRIQSNTFFNIVTVDKTWVHYFEPVRKLGIKNGKLNTVKVMLLPKKQQKDVILKNKQRPE